MKNKKSGVNILWKEQHIVFIAAIFYHLIYFNNKLWAYNRQKATGAATAVPQCAESC